jgi:hypothetical protein
VVLSFRTRDVAPEEVALAERLGEGPPRQSP